MKRPLNVPIGGLISTVKSNLVNTGKTNYFAFANANRFSMNRPAMEIVEVRTKKQAKQFARLSNELYNNVDVWIRPVEAAVEELFNENTSDYPKGTKHSRWLLTSNGHCIGRIAAFCRDNGTDRVGGVGFFECVNDQLAANKLFDEAQSWLRQFGMESMDGPINLGARDKWWGLLTRGFELEPNYECNYNFPYYQQLFENYGFRNYFEHFTFLKPIHEPLHPRLEYKADLISKDEDYQMVHFDLKQFDKMAKDIVTIYNKAWVDHEGVKEMSLEEGKAIIKHLKPILDPRIIWLAYYRKEPVGFYINIPEVNQWLKHVNGKLNFFGKLKFLWYKKTRSNEKMIGKVFGVVPEHQGKGVDGALILAFQKVVLDLEYRDLEISGIGNFNRKMILVIKQVGGEVCKVHTTYRYQFDRELPFERMKDIT